MKTAARQYEALSYVWGSVDNPETISVISPSTGGAEENSVSCSACDGSPLLVTHNLAVALRHLRRRDAPRTLWIDAICIDQQNMAERSEQVAKMAQIYSLAARVVIWLGPASPDSDLAMRLVRDLGQAISYDPKTGTLTSTSNVEAESHWADLDQLLPYEEAELGALKNLFWRPWFERLWVVQEARISAEAVLICGRKEIAWHFVMTALKGLLIKDLKTPWSHEVMVRLREIEVVFDPKRSEETLRSLLEVTRGLKCADDRDRIYALLSLVTYGPRIKPDYSLSTIQVYREVAALWMSMRHLWFLDNCELGNRRLAGPSWIPDWTVKKMTSSLRNFNGMFAQLAFESQAEGLIRVNAVRVGTVVDVDVISTLSSDSITLTREIVRIMPADIESLTYKTGCSLMEAFSGALSCSNLIPEVPQTEDELTLENSMDGLRTILRCGKGLDFEVTEHDRDYFTMVATRTRNRALVRTDQGYVGLAPADVKEGDIILMILSCNSFTVVRPVPGSEGQYNVVGQCFLYGLDDGEVVLGPLPEHVSAESHYHPEADSYYDAYHDTKTGRVSWIDPRLEALGIPIETDADGIPRAISIEALEKAGIRLSQVELV